MTGFAWGKSDLPPPLNTFQDSQMWYDTAWHNQLIGSTGCNEYE